MVRYTDPEDHPELGDDGSRPRRSPAEKLARRRERNAALTGVEAIEGAREVALRKLDARACSRAELQRAMTERGFSEDVATEVLDRLEAVGLVDDRTFAAMLVRDRFSGSGRTGRALVEDLRRRGLDREVIEEALAQVDRDDELERARDLVSHKMRSLGSLDRERAYRRLTGMLARKGYSPGTCSAVVSEALSAREE